MKTVNKNEKSGKKPNVDKVRVNCNLKKRCEVVRISITTVGRMAT